MLTSGLWAGDADVSLFTQQEELEFDPLDRQFSDEKTGLLRRTRAIWPRVGFVCVSSRFWEHCTGFPGFMDHLRTLASKDRF